MRDYIIKEQKSKLESDLISRQAAIEAMAPFDTNHELRDTLEGLPSVGDMGEVSDGYHTFNQLYHQRAVLFATIVNQNKDKAWKSWKHEDGKFCFDKEGEWFIVGVDTPEGSYTYHYEKKYWDMFDCEELDRGKHWDGHTEDDVTRLLSLPPVEPPKKVVAQIKFDADEIVERIKEEYEITEKPVCEDAISRQDAIEALDHINIPTQAQREYAIEIFEDIPQVEPKIYGNEHNCIMTIFGECSYSETGCGSCAVVEKVRDALAKAQMKTQNSNENSNEDAISRKVVEEMLMESWVDGFEYQGDLFGGLAKIPSVVPSVEPERPKGEWVRIEGYEHDAPIFRDTRICSECRFKTLDDWNFCPNCGCDCRGDKE